MLFLSYRSPTRLPVILPDPELASPPPPPTSLRVPAPPGLFLPHPAPGDFGSMPLQGRVAAAVCQSWLLKPKTAVAGSPAKSLLYSERLPESSLRRLLSSSANICRFPVEGFKVP